MLERNENNMFSHTIDCLNYIGFKKNEGTKLGLNYFKKEILPINSSFKDANQSLKAWDMLLDLKIEISFANMSKEMNFNVFKIGKENEAYPYFYLQISIYEEKHGKQICKIIDIFELVSRNQNMIVFLNKEIEKLKTEIIRSFF